MLRYSTVTFGLALFILLAAPAQAEQPLRFDAHQTDEIKEAVDKEATVVGVVSRTAWSPRGNILFINFVAVPRDGFSVVVQKDNKDEIVEAFGETAEKLVGKRVEVKGKISLYRDRPQIDVSKSEQIQIIESEEPAEDEQP